jgi:catechol 2,3-dioxygenase-like lactoylglutathione lyase family enzyme
MLTGLEHYAIRTTKLEETKNFYVDLLGLDDGYRPPFPFPGHWLYLGEHAIVHLFAIDPDNPDGLNDYLGEVDTSNLSGSGAVDHLAFRAEEPEDLMGRIKKSGAEYRDRKVPDLELYQVFLEDPNGITIELNYFNYTE